MLKPIWRFILLDFYVIGDLAQCLFLCLYLSWASQVIFLPLVGSLIPQHFPN
jgi:hypothetical protein